MEGAEPKTSLASAGDSVVVVIDANRNKVLADALAWAIKQVVQRKDTVVVLGLLSQVWKKNSCIPLFSGTWVRLEFSGQGELSPKEFEEELERKREEYQSTLQPFHRQCKKNEVKLEAKLAVGYDPKTITVEVAHKFNPRWIILDSHFKREKMYIYGHVACNVAIMKENGVATLMPSRGFVCEPVQEYKENVLQSRGFVGEPVHEYKENDAENEPGREQDESYELRGDSNWAMSTLTTTPNSCCWYPLSWRTGFPRVFTASELEVMTNGYSEENVIVSCDNRVLYEAIYEETPVLVRRFSANNNQALSLLKILSRIRHRNILNLVGYCHNEDFLALLSDYPCSGTLQMNLQCDESAKNLSWKARLDISLEIGASVRYLHEECADGPIVDNSVMSCHVVLCHGSSALLSISDKAKWLKDDSFCNEISQAKFLNAEKEKQLSADVSDYGVVLIELISGKSGQHCGESREEGSALVNWALPLLENGLLHEIMDPRLVDSSDSAVVDNMVRAALLCLNKDSTRKSTISEVLAVLRGDEFEVTIKV